MEKIGFLINPIAGMGGSVGLKGTDGLVQEAKARGAHPKAHERAFEALSGLKLADSIFLTASGKMGYETLAKAGIPCETVYEAPSETTGENTVKACRKFLDEGVDLIVFCGGDGTARDVFSAVSDDTPMLGIPCGVKMHSAVFSVNTKVVGGLLKRFSEGKMDLCEAEIIDVDEESYRHDVFKTKLYGLAHTVCDRTYIQAGKALISGAGDKQYIEGIAEFAIEFMRDGSAYILGAGSTVGAIKNKLGIPKTLLGVDVVKDGKALAIDADEETLFGIASNSRKTSIIVSPIGAQGFVFGRGNQQISARVIEAAGPENVIYVASPGKLDGLRYLLTDTGDPKVDEALTGYKSVVIGYQLAQKKDVKSGEFVL